MTQKWTNCQFCGKYMFCQGIRVKGIMTWLCNKCWRK